MKTQRQQRRDNNLQRAQARGNTEIRATYREHYAGRRDVTSQTYLGHRASFAVRMQSPLMDNVSRLYIGRGVSDEVASALVTAARATLKPRIGL
jgi:hypothetical protein